MATDPDAVTQQAQEGYKGFCLFVGLSTAFLIAALGLMAIFLL